MFSASARLGRGRPGRPFCQTSPYTHEPDIGSKRRRDAVATPPLPSAHADPASPPRTPPSTAPCPQAFAADFKARHPGGLTVLVNNAGIAFKGNTFGADEADVTLNTNFRGTANVCEALAPLLLPGRGRIVNVSSM